ncbi:NAD(P)-dependent oxidoreductase [Actinoallomurus purpureus]|uniref:NAD-dependent epimerase/dehydratase family protein n=1 Tax=Actinoallomurus purpureus TaxID=478114 RepID=UPI002091F0EB|nr:NAD(P)-dependent oxidoreductase [Actinoallomurus purpureus]MCO6011751.1 NAD(P)-dependent oxidoreductase [Actinoallomurus purpureus]
MSARGVVVLGGSGFVGRHIATAFATAGWDVLVIGRRRPSDLDLPFAPMDLAARRPDEIAGTLGAYRPAVVVNAVGANWNASHAQMRRSNTEAPLRTLTALARMPTRPRFIHLGSVLEYGPVPVGTMLGERGEERPAGPAGLTKLEATRAVRRACTAGVLEGLVLRLPNVTGPGAPVASLAGVVATELSAAWEQGRPAVLAIGPLSDVRDYVDVRDVADAVLSATVSSAGDLVLNLGSGRATPVRALVDLLVDVSGVPATVTQRPAAPGGAAGTQPRDEVPWIQVDATRARAVLGWRPRRSLRDSMRDLWLDFNVGDGYASALHRLELDG